MTLQPLPWHHRQWEQLISRARNKNLAHAFLLKGMPGIGKLLFAKAFSQWLLCEAPIESEACGNCKSCSMIKSGYHPDLLCLEPGTSGGIIKVDQVRQLTEFAHKTAQQGGQRVIILNPAEAMNINAANALLKCLEEPGLKTLFLLVSQRPGDMLPTIKSRCQILSFNTPQKEVGLDWLKGSLPSDNKLNAEVLLNFTNGAPLQALLMSEQGLLEARQALVKSIEDLYRGSRTPVELAREWQDSPHTLLILDWLSNWLEDALKLMLTKDTSYIRNQDQLKLVSYLAAKSRIDSVIEVLDWIGRQRRTLSRGSNLNVQLLLESLLCNYLKLVI